MLTGPLAAKRRKYISIWHREGPDDDAETIRVLPPEQIPSSVDPEILIENPDERIAAMFIPVISDDTLMPGGPVLSDAQYVAYIDNIEAMIMTGAIVKVWKSNDLEKDTRQELSDLYVAGEFKGDVSRRLDLSQSRNFMDMG